MGDDHDAAGEFEERFFERAEVPDVEVVGGSFGSSALAPDMSLRSDVKAGAG